MTDFQINSDYELTYILCIYSGISNKLDFETKYGDEDKTEELSYIVEKYCRECLISGKNLQEKLNNYITTTKERRESYEQTRTIQPNS